MESILQIDTGDTPAIRVEDGASAFVCLERFWIGYGSKAKTVIDHASTRTLYLRHLTGTSYANSVSGGTVFIDNVCADGLTFNGQHVWARQLNPEAKGGERFNIRNRVHICGFSA